MAGEIKTPMLICLQEESGTFGPLVSQNLERPENLYITCTKSGKINKDIMRTFFQHSVVPKIDLQACFVLDAWRGQSDDDIFSVEGKVTEIRRLPEGSTGFLMFFVFDSGSST
jgi:hypothetical protein